MKGTVVVIHANGQVEENHLYRELKLSDLRDAVGGYIELIPFFNKWKGKDCMAFCNEEGKLHKLPINNIAQEAWEECVGHIISTDLLVGDIVICHGDREFMKSI